MTLSICMWDGVHQLLLSGNLSRLSSHDNISHHLFSVLLIDSGKLVSYDDAIEDESSIQWKLATKDEMNSLLTNQM